MPLSGTRKADRDLLFRRAAGFEASRVIAKSTGTTIRTFFLKIVAARLLAGCFHSPGLETLECVNQRQINRHHNGKGNKKQNSVPVARKPTQEFPASAFLSQTQTQ